MAVTTTTSPAGVKKRHIPAVGIIGLVLIIVATGGIFHTQFLHPPNTTCTVAPIHRVYVMSAIIQDLQGYQVLAIYQTNITGTIPTNSSGVPSTFNNGNFTNLPARTDSKEVYGNPGDLITIFIRSTNSTDSRQYTGIPGHGFDFTDNSFMRNLNVTGGSGTASQPTPTVLAFGKWVTMTFQIAAQGSGGFFCTVSCSDQHQNMKGTLRAGCGG